MADHSWSASANPTYRVLIIGCGLAGLAAAIGIRRVGHEVTILEKAAELQELGAGINVSPNGTFVFKEWGILDAIKDKADIPYAASMRSYKDSFQLFSQPLGRQMEELYSTPYLVIHRADLHSVLVQEADRLGVAIHLDSHFTRINFSDPSVELSNGKTYDADIILGADGERSACRDALLGYKIPS